MTDKKLLKSSLDGHKFPENRNPKKKKKRKKEKEMAEW